MKKIFLTMLAAAALVSCTKSEINPINEGVEISLRSDVIDASGVVSRAPFEGAVSTANVLEARVAASAAQNFGTLIANGVMKFNGSVAANYEQPLDAGNSKFPSNFTSTTPAYLYGVYPSGWTISNAVAEYTFTGKEDVMAAGKVSTTQQDVIDAAYKTLSFKHLLTRLEVKLSAAAPTVAPILGDITAIKLIGSDANSTTAVNNKVSANYASELALTFSSSATSLSFYGLSLDADGKKAYTNTAVPTYALTSDPTLVAYSLVAPVTATSAATKEYFLEIKTANVTEVKRVPVDLLKADGDFFEGSTAGRSFTVSINFKSTEEIAAQATVEEWDEQGEWKGEVIIN